MQGLILKNISIIILVYFMWDIKNIREKIGLLHQKRVLKSVGVLGISGRALIGLPS